MNGQAPWSGLFKTSVIIPLITLFLGFSLGFYATSIFPVNIPTSSSQKEFILSSIPSKPTIDESKLPISLSLLTNPIVGQWRGYVQGKLTKKDGRTLALVDNQGKPIKKDEHTFTLVDDKGNSIIITDITPSGDKFNTIFYDISNKKKEEASLSAIPIGSILSGDFWIFKGGSNTPVGGMFTRK